MYILSSMNALNVDHSHDLGGGSCMVLLKARKDMNNVSIHCDMTEILLEAT